MKLFTRQADAKIQARFSFTSPPPDMFCDQRGFAQYSLSDDDEALGRPPEQVLEIL